MTRRGVLALALLVLLVLPPHGADATTEADLTVTLRHAWDDRDSYLTVHRPLVAGFENPVIVVLDNPASVPFTGRLRVDVEPAAAATAPTLVQPVRVGAFTTRALEIPVGIVPDATGSVTVHARVDGTSSGHGTVQRGFRVAPPVSVEIVSPRPLATTPDRAAFLGTDGSPLHDVTHGGVQWSLRDADEPTPVVIRVTNRGPALPDAGTLAVRWPDPRAPPDERLVRLGPLDAGASRDVTLDPIPAGADATRRPLLVSHLPPGQEEKGMRDGPAPAFTVTDGRVTGLRPASLNVLETDANLVRFVSLPATVVAGEPVTAHVRVENRGTEPLDDAYALVFTPPACGDLGGGFIGNTTRVTLAPGGSTTTRFTFTPRVAGVWGVAFHADEPGCRGPGDARVLVDAPARVTLAPSMPRPFNDFSGGPVVVRVMAIEDVEDAVLRLQALPRHGAPRSDAFGAVHVQGAAPASVRVDPPEASLDLRAGEARDVTFTLTTRSSEVAWFLPVLTLGERVVTAVQYADTNPSDPQLPRTDHVIVSSDDRSIPVWVARLPLVVALALGGVSMGNAWRARRAA